MSHTHDPVLCRGRGLLHSFTSRRLWADWCLGARRTTRAKPRVVAPEEETESGHLPVRGRPPSPGPPGSRGVAWVASDPGATSRRLWADWCLGARRTTRAKPRVVAPDEKTESGHLPETQRRSSQRSTRRATEQRSSRPACDAILKLLEVPWTAAVPTLASCVAGDRWPKARKGTRTRRPRQRSKGHHSCPMESRRPFPKTRSQVPQSC